MALKYQGHVWDSLPNCTCCVGDAKAVADDPTGTKRIRKAFLRDATIRWQQVKTVVREMLITNDMLGLKTAGLLSLTAATNPALHGGADKVKMFQSWFDTVLDRLVLESSGMWIGPFVKQGYDEGQAFGEEVIGARVMLNSMPRIETIRALALIEVQGIMEAVSQQAVRAVANGILVNAKPLEIVRDISMRIDKIGIVRTRAMIELIVVKAYGDATLDVYQSAGITKVGLIPEVRQITTVADARKKVLKKRKPSPTNPSGGAGSRSSRKRTPSGSTIRRIEEQEERLERLGRVRVRTAEDDDVCPVCEKIAAGGPYTIDKARSLIPAHPRCRCVFIPADDLRFRENRRAQEEPEEPDDLPEDEPAEPAPRAARKRVAKAVVPPAPRATRARYVVPKTQKGIEEARRALEAKEQREAAAYEALLNRNAVAQVEEMEARFARMRAQGRKPKPEQLAKLKRLKLRAAKVSDAEGMATFGTNTSFAEGAHKPGKTPKHAKVPKRKAKAKKVKKPKKR